MTKEFDLYEYERKVAFDLLNINEPIYKFAQISISPSGVLSDISSFLQDQFNGETGWNVVKAVLQPAVISLIFKAANINPAFSLLTSVLLEVFHIDIFDIVSNICKKIFSFVKQEKQPSNEDISQIVDESIGEKLPLEATASTIEQLDAIHRRFKTAMYIYSIDKTAGISSFLLSQGLRTFFKHFFSALIGKALGKGISKVTEPSDQKSQQQSSVPAVVQSKYPVKGSFADKKYFSTAARSAPILATDASITQYLLDLAEDKYDNLGKIKNQIINNEEFQVAKNMILQSSLKTLNKNILIPEIFDSKNLLIDYFMDNVLEEVR